MDSKPQNSRKDMTYLDRLFMHPIEKFQVYGKFPWKLVLHVLSVIVPSAQVLHLTMPNGQYSYNQLVLSIMYQPVNSTL